tara:strand:+ start:798 stop:1538 length:741 start_codon:yes stop_codon:yes gene_type:complete
MIKQSKNIVILALFYLICFFCTGCARTISTDSDIFNIEIKLSLNAAVNTSKYNYYIIFSTQSTPLIEPQIIETLNEYFPTPAQSYSNLGLDLNSNANGSLAYYYSTFFSTWSDYILIQDNSVYFVQSGSTSFAADTTDNASYVNSLTFDSSLTVLNNTITLTFDTDQLGLVENDILYFTFLTAKRSSSYGSNDQSGLIQDTISEQSYITISLQQEEKNLNESITSSESGGTIDMASDITSWEVSIF